MLVALRFEIPTDLVVDVGADVGSIVLAFLGLHLMEEVVMV